MLLQVERARMIVLISAKTSVPPPTTSKKDSAAQKTSASRPKMCAQGILLATWSRCSTRHVQKSTTVETMT